MVVETVTDERRARTWRPLFFCAVIVIFWLGGTGVALYIKRTQLLVGFDGGYMRSLAERQFEWRIPIFTASFDPLQGLGDTFFPNNFQLFPAFLASAAFGREIVAPVVTYAITLTEFTLGILFFGRVLGASRTVSFAAAIFAGLAMFPFASPSLVYPILALVPMMGTIVAAALVMGGAFLSFGRGDWRADLGYAALILGLLVWWLLASSTGLILGAPFLLLCGVSGVLAAASAAERWRKMGLFGAVSLLLLTTGPVLYIVGMTADTAAATFPLELTNSRANFLNASILFQWHAFGPTGPLLVGLAIAGALTSISDRRHRTLRVFAITLLTYLGTRLTFAVLTIVFDFWRGPVPLYFEFFVIPLYAIFAVQFVARVFNFARCSAGLRAPSAALMEIGLTMVGVALAITLAATTPSSDYAFHYPPMPTPFTELIASQTSIRPGKQFRGRTANMTGRTINRPIDWLDLHVRDGALSGLLGNEMRVTGLQSLGIPSLFEYTPTITPAFYAATSRWLAAPGDAQTRSVSVLRRIDLRILAMFGVRFVITDAPIEAPAKLRASLPINDATLYLFEVERPNLGNYSPTIVHKPAEASDIVARIADVAFDPSREVIGDLPESGDGLVPASGARLTFETASLRVEARSSGRSILLLPLEFSRCLKLTAAPSGEPRIFRANLLETGVIFSGSLDATLALRTSPFFLNPGCRLWDYFDMTALQIGKVPPVAMGVSSAAE
jgi:hypothetical protein